MNKEIIEEMRAFVEIIRPELAEGLKAGLTGNEAWSGEFIKKPIKRHEGYAEIDLRGLEQEDEQLQERRET